MTKKFEDIRKMISEDQRRCERLSLDVEVLYSFNEEKDSCSCEWIRPFALENISGNGISLNVNEKLALGTRLQIMIALPGDLEPMCFWGTIVWCKEHASSSAKEEATPQQHYLIGIQFDEISQKYEKQFISFMSDNILSKYSDVQGK
ncbi:MAG: PilZ domain-containing protein [Candidatus Omnitrophica bacterium]|nr:PilZ domain-containing protein [Candidatus Omnitrophota bacterium]